MFVFTQFIKDISPKDAIFIAVTGANLHQLYNEQMTNIYVNGEITDGFSEEEIREAIRQRNRVIAVQRNDAEARRLRRESRI